MNSDEFRQRGKEMVDYIADYLENIKDRRVTPQVEPGYLRSLVANEAPSDGQDWDSIMNEVNEKIMPGITHWQHPHFHAYFPAGNAYPSILADMLSSGLGVVGFSWAASPACTELETIVIGWLGKMYNLPKCLLPFEDAVEADQVDENMNSPAIKSNVFFNGDTTCDSEAVPVVPAFVPHRGGGVILSTASECVLVSMLAARRRVISKYKRDANYEGGDDGSIVSRLIAYSSKLAHSCVEKAAMIALCKIRLLETDEDYSLRGETLQKAIQEDIDQGLVPFFVCCTLGTTCCCSFDNLMEIGPICQDHDLYLHVDAAYAGNALICDEYRHLMQGLEHWGIALSRRFRSLKLWFTIKSYGVSGLQAYIKEHVRLAKVFENLIVSDPRFEIIGKVTMGLVCFRLKGHDSLSKSLLYVLNDNGEIHMTPAILNDKYIIRFCVNSAKATESDMHHAWALIQARADQIIKDYEERNDSLNKYQLDKFIEIDSLIDFSKIRRSCFTKMISMPVRTETNTSPNIPLMNLKRRLSRLKTVYNYTDEMQEVDPIDHQSFLLSHH